ncbi:MAG: beta-lactamase family protein [Acidobacteriota bacterium]|nr:beta-lactamase family protein [Acidobacteriota bacterium]
MSFKILTIILCIFVFAPVIFGQSAITQITTKVELPNDTLGNIMREWLAAIENGDEAEINRFVENRFSVGAKKNQPNAAKYFRKLHEQSGGLELIRVTPPAGEFPMSILAKSKRGEHFASITVGRDRNEEGKLAGLGVYKAQNPNTPKLSATTKILSEAEMIAEIKAEVERRAAAGDFSGVVLVAKDDKILLHKAYGLADVENKVPNKLETKFHLASVGKMFTAVSIAQLVKAGKLSYEDTVGRILPDFPNPEFKKITIHQLLTHTAGMGTFFESPGIVPGKAYRNATEEIAVYKDEKLYFEPGARWRYSNAGFSLLGAIIEKVSGKTYIEYVRENVFKPLNMEDKAKNPGDISVLYNQSDEDPLGVQAYPPVKGIIDSVGTGFGGGYLDTGDLFKFARAYRTGKLLGAETIEKIAKGKISENAKGDACWGYGIKERDINGELVRGHSGGGRTDVQMLWNSGHTVIVQTNKVPLPATALSGEIIMFITKQNQMKNAKTTANVK